MATSLRVDVPSPDRGGFVPGMPDGAGFSAAVQHTRHPGGDDGLLVLIQRRGLRGTAGPMRMPGGGFAEVSPVEELRLFRFNRALSTIRQYEPGNREATFMAAPNQPPSEDWTRKVEAEASAVLLRQRAGPGASLPASPMPPAEQARLGVAPGATSSPAATGSAAGPPGFLQFHDWDAAKSGVRADGIPYATVRGTIHNLDGWHVEPFQYAKRDPAATDTLRRQFDGFGRADFCEYLALQHRPELEAAGLTSQQIDTLNKGEVPDGYQVHHVRPLDGGGTNDHANLLLMRQDPEHLTVTAYQTAARNGLRPGQTRLVQWPVPPAGTLVWPVRPQGGQPQ